MPKPRTEAYVFYQGIKYQIEFYHTRKGDVPAREFLESLKQPKVLVKLAALVKLIGDEGVLYDKQKFRIVDKEEKIYEFKPGNFRFFNFFFKGRKIIITNGYQKKSRKVDGNELKRSLNFKNDYTQRVLNGEYYGK